MGNYMQSMKTSRFCFRWLLALTLVAMASPLAARPPLAVGDEAPMFSGHDQDGHRWSLRSHIGKSVVLLYFYPKDDTRGCTMEACGLRDRMPDFKQRDVAVVGVSFDNAASHKNFTFKYNLNFPLLADTERRNRRCLRSTPGARQENDAPGQLFDRAEWKDHSHHRFTGPGRSFARDAGGGRGVERTDVSMRRSTEFSGATPAP